MRAGSSEVLVEGSAVRKGSVAGSTAPALSVMVEVKECGHIAEDKTILNRTALSTTQQFKLRSLRKKPRDRGERLGVRLHGPNKVDERSAA
jgi:hypothetical protein